ncbi:MAG: 5,10-methylenetetrahydrofolate reductase, partial [Candidatus Omnitrophota bacterium]
GVILLKSASMARYMNEHVAGISVPEEIIAKIDSAQDKAAASIEIASVLIRKLKPLCRGIHIMSIGWEEMVPRVLEASGF